MRASEIARIVAAHLNEGEDMPMASLFAAVPHFFVALSTICIERRDLGVLREFILRAIQVGFKEPPNISGFLGVRVSDVNDELVELIEGLYVVTDSSDGRLVLLEKGARTISVNGLTRTIIRDTACVLNGVTRRVAVSSGNLVPRRRLAPQTLVLPATPARSPRIEEIDLASVKAAMLATKAAQPRLLEVSRLGRVIRVTNLYLPGYLLLRRGSQSIPIVGVGGTTDAVVAQKVGNHPAIQFVRKAIERHEQYVKRFISQRKSDMRGLAPCDAQARVAITKLVAFVDADESRKVEAGRAFTQAAQQLVHHQHWLCDAEAQVIFAHALLNAKEKIVIVAPASSSAMFGRETLEGIKLAVARGVLVEMHVQANDHRLTSKQGALKPFLKGAQLIPLNSTSGWCGLCCDQHFAVIGLSKIMKSSMGEFEAFFGALILGGHIEKLLSDIAFGASAPVTVKRRKRIERTNRGP